MKHNMCKKNPRPQTSHHNMNKSEEHLQSSQLFNTQENACLGLSYMLRTQD